MRVYENKAGLKEIYQCKDSTITAVRRFIQQHPERYTNLGTIRNLTHVGCFADAYKYRDYDVSMLPPFDAVATMRLLGQEGGDDVLRSGQIL